VREGINYLEESARGLASTAARHLQQMKELSWEFGGSKSEMMKSGLSRVSGMQDHQLIMLCIIFSLLGLISFLKILQFFSYLPSPQTSDERHSCEEHGNQKEASAEEEEDEFPGETKKVGEMSPGPVHVDVVGEEMTDDEISE